MAPYSCFYFTTESGDSPVEKFIDSLDYKTQRKFFFKKGLLQEFGPRLPYPHAKRISDDIYELRLEGVEGSIRVLYFFFYKNEIIFTNGFVKKSNRTPKEGKRISAGKKKIIFKQEG